MGFFEHWLEDSEDRDIGPLSHWSEDHDPMKDYEFSIVNFRDEEDEDEEYEDV